MEDVIKQILKISHILLDIVYTSRQIETLQLFWNEQFVKYSHNISSFGSHQYRVTETQELRKKNLMVIESWDEKLIQTSNIVVNYSGIAGEFLVGTGLTFLEGSICTKPLCQALILFASTGNRHSSHPQPSSTVSRILQRLSILTLTLTVFVSEGSHPRLEAFSSVTLYSLINRS